jgi:hypothetical protein
MPHVARPPSGRPGLDDSALITFHEVDAQYPVMSSTNLAALMSPFAPDQIDLIQKIQGFTGPLDAVDPDDEDDAEDDGLTLKENSQASAA